MELRGERVVLRPLAEADVPRLAEIGAEAGVFRWWGPQPAEDLGRKARGEEPDETFFAILVEGELAGLIQYSEENDAGLPPRRDRPLPLGLVPGPRPRRRRRANGRPPSDRRPRPPPARDRPGRGQRVRDQLLREGGLQVPWA